MGIPLSTINGTLVSTQSLTYAIYWASKHMPDALANGHAAVIIDSVKFLEGVSKMQFNSEWYVSWCGGKSTAKGNLAVTEDFFEDAQTWGGVKMTPKATARMPTRWVALKGLDIDAMKAAWDQIRTKQNAHWRLLDKNCATIAARVLKAGGGDTYATSSKKQLVWWPTDVIRYARSMTGIVYQTSSDAEPRME